jgi:pimeloyl-ACP methyl ester carboxylesterase
MKNVYFQSAERPQSFMKKMLYTSSKWLTSISPFISEKVAKTILANPASRRQYQMRTSIEPSLYFVETIYGKICLQKFEQPDGRLHKNILLCHGWGDTSTRFTQLINHLVTQGFCVWSYDQIGHGKSVGESYSHLFAFIEGTKRVLRYLYNMNVCIDTIVGHSMGALALLNLTIEERQCEKIILISMPAFIFSDMYRAVVNVGFCDSMLTSYLERLSKKQGVNWQQLTAEHHLGKITDKVLVIHDLNDVICAFFEVKKLLVNTPCELFETRELGHVKLLKSKIVLDKVSRFISANNE